MAGQGFGTATSSGSLAVSTGAVVIPSAVGTSGVMSGILWGVTLTPAAAACTLSVYDNNAGDNTGTLLDKITAVANGASIVLDYAIGTGFTKGLTYILSGTGATAVIRYELGG